MKWSVNVDAIIAFQNVLASQCSNSYNEPIYRSELTISHCDLFECPLDAGYRTFYTTYLEHWSNHCVTMKLQGLHYVSILSSSLN